MIPIIASILFRLGGDGRYPFLFINGWNAKWWRWSLGLPLAVFVHASFLNTLLAFLSYLIATNIPYGDTSWLNKYVSRNIKWCIYGFCFGLASFSLLGMLSLIQAIIGMCVFYGLMKLSNDGVFLWVIGGTKGLERRWYLDQKYVELGTGLLGTILYLCK